MTVRDLLSGERYTGAVLKFLRATRVGEAKAGSLNRSKMCLGLFPLLSFTFFPSLSIAIPFPSFLFLSSGRPRDSLRL